MAIYPMHNFKQIGSCKIYTSISSTWFGNNTSLSCLGDWDYLHSYDKRIMYLTAIIDVYNCFV